MPKGPAAQGGWHIRRGLGVVEASTKKEAAYLFCQWAISHDMGARLLQAGAGVPFRQSILEDAKVREGVKMPAEWLDAVVGSGKVSKLALPVIIPVTEFRDIYGVGLTKHDRRRRSRRRNSRKRPNSSHLFWHAARDNGVCQHRT